jgi:hypothetical protein
MPLRPKELQTFPVPVSRLCFYVVKLYGEPANPLTPSRQPSPCPSESPVSPLFQIVSLRTFFGSKKCLLFRCISNLKNYKLQTKNYKLSPCPSVSPVFLWFKILVSLRTTFFPPNKCLLIKSISNLKNYKLQTTNYKLNSLSVPLCAALSPWFKKIYDSTSPTCNRLSLASLINSQKRLLVC